MDQDNITFDYSMDEEEVSEYLKKREQSLDIFIFLGSELEEIPEELFRNYGQQ